MEVTALCTMLMFEFTLLQNTYAQNSDGAFLSIIPNRLQHFKFQSVSFHCEGSDGSIQLRGIRNTEEFDPQCVIKRTPTGSLCTTDRAYPEDSGEYWCETNGGKTSNRVNITVAAGSVILDSPALPVLEGDNVTLHCRNKTISNLLSDFYKDDLLIETNSTGEMTILNVSKADEGLYKCRLSGGETSPGSWLAVRANYPITSPSHHITSPSPHEEPLPRDSAHVVLIQLWITVIILMMVLVLVIVGFLHIRKRRVSSKKNTACSVSGAQSEDDPSGVTYAVVVTKQRKDEDSADAADNLSPETNHSREPQKERDEDESSVQLVYSTVVIKKTSQDTQPAESELSSSTVSLNPTAATDPNTTEPETLYSTTSD
ncbi:uncharacterized protein LOC127379586 isoform X2 [Dicentrarchus labrax]|uniref:uncharacterized protein LOC127379586 isoform X2 n=1 Tax=Dicentrarchus labrax TaxID=13489 RepID=UPI0021F50683|nr:uncharacterized protein LOC127379586 isoform X2 [Dicentrarchus labrax]